VGVSEEVFLEDFTRYVRLRGFRPGRLEHAPPRSEAARPEPEAVRREEPLPTAPP
jgi:hypothetical protein